MGEPPLLDDPALASSDPAPELPELDDDVPPPVWCPLLEPAPLEPAPLEPAPLEPPPLEPPPASPALAPEPLLLDDEHAATAATTRTRTGVWRIPEPYHEDPNRP